jgi:hypothetical protein
MRVIRTELYFEIDDLDDPNILFKEHQLPSVSFAWFHNEYQNINSPSVHIDGFLPLLPISGPVGATQELFPWARTPPDVVFERFLDLTLSGKDEIQGRRDLTRYPRMFRDHKLQQTRALEVILSQSIVIERSPPTSLPVKGMIGDSAQMLVGAYLGSEMVPGHDPLLMLLAAAAGIIVIGSARGISKGLEKGLAQSVEGLFSGRAVRRRRPPPGPP